MRVCVVGATGVIGRSLVPLLLRRGYAVRAFVRSPEKARPLLDAGAEIERFDLLEVGTVARLTELLSGCVAVVHAATAIPRDPSAPGAWDTNTRLRTEGTRVLLEASLTAGAEAYVQQSIALAYPDSDERWIDEGAPLDTSPGRAEVVAPVRVMEAMVRSVNSGRLRWTVLRGGTLVGPGTAQETTVARLRAGEEMVQPDAGFLSLVHVTDFAEAVEAAIRRAPAGSTFNVVDEPLRQGKYLDRLADLVGAARPPRDPSASRPPSLRCSNRAAREALGWTPAHGVLPRTERGFRR